jgi:CHAT domain-containing protein/Tfp pilus assembly protein PilF
MTQPLFFRKFQSKYRSWVVYCSLIPSISLTLVQIHASPNTSYADNEVKPHTGVVSQAQENHPPARLEPGKPIERELTGGQSHKYQIALAAGQYSMLTVDQRGINVAIKLFGPDSKQIAEFDSEVRTHGQETISWVGIEAGNYRLDVAVKHKNVAVGRYEIQVVEVRAATEGDRSLHEALKLDAERARLYVAGKYDEALPLAERALELRTKSLGSDHRDVASALNSLALLYQSKGNAAKAEPLYQRALTIKEKTLGPAHPEIAITLNNLANLFSDRGDYAQAELLYGRALTIRENALGIEHPDLASSLNNLANLYRRRGDYIKAEPFYQRALNIWEKSLGPEHATVAIPLINLAILYKVRGDFTKAESLYQRTLAIWEKSLGPEHPDILLPLNNLAIIFNDRGDYAKAESFYQRALTIGEKTLGPEHPDVTRVLTNLGNTYQLKGNYAKAEQFYRRALAIKEKVMGAEHIMVASTLNSLAKLYRKRGDYERAKPLHHRALTIQESVLGAEHPDVAETLIGLAMLNASIGDIAQALTFLSRANAIDERNLTLNLAIGSDHQKILYLAKFSQSIHFTLSLQSQVAPSDMQALDLAFTTLLRRKGRGLDAMTDMIATLRRHATPQDRELFDRLAEARSQLAALTFKEPGTAKPDTYRKRITELETEVGDLEAELSSRSTEFRKQRGAVTLATIQAIVPAGNALIEFAVYSPLDPQTEKSRPSRYLVYLLPAQGRPKWVDLGEAAVIDRAVDAWRSALRDPNRTDVKRLSRTVDERVMRPVRALLSEIPGDTRHLLIAPDGSLNLIPFAALVDERNRYLVKRYSISYLTSGRDLLRLQASEPSKSAPLVVANPLFGISETIAGISPGQISANSPGRDQPDNQTTARDDPREVFFQALPGTRREALAIKAALPEASLLLREDASETALKQARAPQILHIATHGFFLQDQEVPPPDTRGFSTPLLRISDPRLMKWSAKIENPLLRSGLALAGVNHKQSGDDDGLLTALETVSLDLSGTKLVVLSACDTGVGEVKNGEGVYGLRRALVLAGSETQVTSLWPVSDRETRRLMTGYYMRLMKGEGRGEALRQIQLEMIKTTKLRHPYYWASFIQAGEWANLDGHR